MFQWLWEILAIPLGYLMRWSYLLFHDILRAPLPYLFAMVLFALLTRILQVPLSISQQKASAKTAAIQPLIQEIQKKFAKDKNRQNTEIQKLQEEMGVSMMSGCLPLLITFPIMFTVIEIIYKPLTYMLNIPKDLISELTAIVGSASGTQVQNEIIKLIQTPGSTAFASQWISHPDAMRTIQELDLNFAGVHLLDRPSISQPSLMWLFPLFMVVTMFISQLFTLKASGQSGSGQPGTGKTMMLSMTALFAVFSFMYPAGFSLYWGLSNLIMMGQSAVMRRIVNPAAVKQQVLETYEAKRKARKAAKTVLLKDETTGQVVEKTISAAELARLRLQKAREQDEQRYGGLETAPAGIETPQRTEEEVKQLNEDFAVPASEKGKGKKKKQK